MVKEDIGILERDKDGTPAAVVSTIPGLFLQAIDKHRKPDAFRFKENGRWADVSTDEFVLRVEQLFFGLRALGLKPAERVAIISENRVEWAITDYAAQSASAITVPIYPTLSAPQTAALLKNCEPVVVFVSTASLLEKLLAVQRDWTVRYVVAFDREIYRPGVLRLERLYDLGLPFTSESRGEFQRSILAVDPNSIATIIYTSGTTGVPKGAMLTHRNLTSNILATSEVLPLSNTDVSLSFLPLSHIFQRHVDYAALRAGSTIAYAQSVTTVPEDVMDVRPTFCAGVPRFFEKMYARIMSEATRATLVRRTIFEKAVQIGKTALRSGRSSLAYRAADRAVFQKIRERLGGRIRFFISGGAALEKEITEFFHAVGLPIFEGYGLTETSPVITLNGPGAWRIGTVGRPVGDVQVQIADDGEILVRGSSVMTGYYKMESETAEALRGGWFHTGDTGELDPAGYLRVTDRKKDLIVTSGGKNVAPQPIENRLKLSPYFENVVVIGDGRKFIAALIVPNYTTLAAYARAQNIAFDNPAELIKKQEIYDFAMSEIERQTQDLSSFEKVKKIAFIENAFTIESGELTPTLKVRRSVIEKQYIDLIDQLYADV